MREPRLSREAGATWSVVLRDVDTGQALFEREPHQVLATASVGKIFALVDLAARVVAGELDLGERLARDPQVAVSDSGLWQHLRTDRLPLGDLAALIGQCSDNWATNVLLGRLGLDRVQARARELTERSMLHDLVRDERTEQHAPTLSTGCAEDWVGVVTTLARGTCIDGTTSALVRGWLGLNVDATMVASALLLDPLAPGDTSGTRLINKTGTDIGVRADVGVVATQGRTVAYACLCTWDDDGTLASRGPVLASMREVGTHLLELAGIRL